MLVAASIASNDFTTLLVEAHANETSNDNHSLFEAKLGSFKVCR